MSAPEIVQREYGARAGFVVVTANSVSVTGIAPHTAMITARTEGDGDEEQRPKTIVGSLQNDPSDQALVIR